MMNTSDCHQIQGTCSVCIFTTTLKKEIGEHVTNVYSNIDVVDADYNTLIDYLHANHPLSGNAKKSEYSQMFDKHVKKLENSLDLLRDVMDKYNDSMELYNQHSILNTSEVITIVQKQMPTKVVDPFTLWMSVLTKINTTQRTINEAKDDWIIQLKNQYKN